MRTLILALLVAASVGCSGATLAQMCGRVVGAISDGGREVNLTVCVDVDEDGRPTSWSAKVEP